MAFIPDFNCPPMPQKNALWFLLKDQKLLVRCEQDQCLVPSAIDVDALALMPERKEFLGTLDGIQCYAGEIAEGPLPEAYAFMRLTNLMARLEKDVIQVAGLANQLFQWKQKHQYCGRCGNKTQGKTDERARVCPRCGLINYPRLSPAVIVAVIRGHRILLANAQRFPSKFYSVLAGFVEPGETLEDCVKREIFEEVGIRVKNIRYFGSQPWPFPDSLMLAFTAEYAGGEIKTDGDEIADAGWFSASDLPAIPGPVSIARQLIDWFVERKQQ